MDQVAAIVAPFVLGDPKAPSLALPAGAALPRLEHAQGLRIGEDVWIEGYVRPARARRVSARSRARS